MTRPALCWYVEPCDCDWPNGECICPDVCNAELDWIDGRWVCPAGHRIRQYADLNPWLRDHIEILQGSPGLSRRYFGDRP